MRVCVCVNHHGCREIFDAFKKFDGYELTQKNPNNEHAIWKSILRPRCSPLYNIASLSWDLQLL